MFVATYRPPGSTWVLVGPVRPVGFGLMDATSNVGPLVTPGGDWAAGCGSIDIPTVATIPAVSRGRLFVAA
jgi:hypothetical protein